MPAKRKTFTCHHFGFGTFCHRCKQAEVLGKNAELPAYAKQKNEMVTEAKRLRSPAQPKPSKRSARVAQPTVESV